MPKLKGEKLYSIRAYCTECKSMLLESVPLTKRELMVNWDDAVLKAPNIMCEKCGFQIPNFHLNLKIYHKALKREFDPSKILPAPKIPEVPLPFKK